MRIESCERVRLAEGNLKPSHTVLPLKSKFQLPQLGFVSGTNMVQIHA